MAEPCTERLKVGDTFVTKTRHQLILAGATVIVTKIEELPLTYWAWVVEKGHFVTVSDHTAVILVKDGEENSI